MIDNTNPESLFVIVVKVLSLLVFITRYCGGKMKQGGEMSVGGLHVVNTMWYNCLVVVK